MDVKQSETSRGSVCDFTPQPSGLGCTSLRDGDWFLIEVEDKSSDPPKMVRKVVNDVVHNDCLAWFPSCDIKKIDPFIAMNLMFSRFVLREIYKTDDEPRLGIYRGFTRKVNPILQDCADGNSLLFFFCPTDFLYYHPSIHAVTPTRSDGWKKFRFVLGIPKSTPKGWMMETPIFVDDGFVRLWRLIINPPRDKSFIPRIIFEKMRDRTDIVGAYLNSYQRLALLLFPDVPIPPSIVCNKETEIEERTRLVRQIFWMLKENDPVLVEKIDRTK